jgi:TRAP-type C4-dicarboxylate transport system permease small subunit
MSLKQHYARAMEKLYVLCVVISGLALVTITLIIPFGVFMRYLMNNPQSWPEPASVVMMVLFSFVGGAAVYRANVHIAVESLTQAVGPALRGYMAHLVQGLMCLMALFMIFYGLELCHITWNQSVPEFPGLPVGLVYGPIPLGGVLTLLFLVEKVWVGPVPRSSFMFSDEAVEME